MATKKKHIRQGSDLQAPLFCPKKRDGSHAPSKSEWQVAQAFNINYTEDDWCKTCMKEARASRIGSHQVEPRTPDTTDAPTQEQIGTTQPPVPQEGYGAGEEDFDPYAQAQDDTGGAEEEGGDDTDTDKQNPAGDDTTDTSGTEGDEGDKKD